MLPWFDTYLLGYGIIDFREVYLEVCNVFAKTIGSFFFLILFFIIMF